MNPLVVLIGAGIAVTGLILKSDKKDLTNDKKESKKKSTEHAKSVPDKKDEIKPNQNSSTTDNISVDNVDDLGTDEKPE